MNKALFLLIFTLFQTLSAQIPNNLEGKWKGEIMTYDGIQVLKGDLEIELDNKKLKDELRFFIDKFSSGNLQNFQRLKYTLKEQEKGFRFNHISPTDANRSVTNGEYDFTLNTQSGKADYLLGIFKGDKKNFAALAILFRNDDYKKLKSSKELNREIENIIAANMADIPEEKTEMTAVDVNSVSSEEPTIYIVGQEEDKITKNYVAKIWINGVAQNLTNGETLAGASSVFVAGDDVYVAGQESNSNGISIAKIWKNGIPQNLTDGSYSAYATDIYIWNHEIYVSVNGYENGNSVAMLWKNGVLQKLSDSYSYAWSVFVDNEKNIYVTGHEQSKKPVSVTAKVWKNGVLQNVTPNGARANDIIVKNNDIYVVGFDNNKMNSVGALWKNGVSQNLTNLPSNISSLFIDNENNIYVAGQENKAAKVWKNGKPQYLTNGETPAFARSVFVKGNDVYVVGQEGDTAKIWKNGIPENLTDGKTYATATDVFVK